MPISPQIIVSKIDRLLFPEELTGEASLRRFLIAFILLKAVLITVLATGDTLSIHRFVTMWIASGFENPWEYLAKIIPALANHNPGPFPYPPLMLYILGAFRCVAYVLGFTGSEYMPWNGWSLRLGIFLLDCAVAQGIVRTLRTAGANTVERRNAFVLWHLSFIAFYVTYLQGQFDILPVALTLLGVLLSLSGRHVAAFLSVGVAIGTKHYAVVFFAPLLTSLMHDRSLTVRQKIQTVAISAVSLVILFAAVYGPFLGSKEFKEKVLLFHESQRVWAPTFVLIRRILWIYFSVFFAGTIALLSLTSARPRAENMIVTSFLLLTIFTTVVAPMPGWCVWGLPFALMVAVRIPNGIWLFLAYNLTFILYHTYYEWSAFTELAAYWRWNWPVSRTPFVIIRDAAGLPAAYKVLNLFYSLNCAAQMALVLAWFRAECLPPLRERAAS